MCAAQNEVAGLLIKIQLMVIFSIPTDFNRLRERFFSFFFFLSLIPNVMLNRVIHHSANIVQADVCRMVELLEISAEISILLIQKYIVVVIKINILLH